MFSRIVLTLLLLLSPIAAGAQGVSNSIGGNQGISGNITSQGLSFGGASSPFPVLDGQAPTIYADFTSEGLTNKYFVSGVQQANFAAWMTAMGGTFARTGNATLFKSGVINTAATGVPRFPTDLAGNPLGIRLTASQQNIMLHSEFDAASWTAVAATSFTPATVPGPNGNATSAAGYVPSGTNANHGIFLSATTTYATNTYTWSIFAKNNGYNFLVMDPSNIGPGGTLWSVCDLTTGATTKGSTATASGSVQLANGWWYCWFTGPKTAGASATIYGALPTNSFAAFVGDTVSGIQMFGASAVLGSFPPDYIPTTTVAVTQNADDLHTTVAWYTADAAQNTLFVDATVDNPGNAAPGLAAIWDQGVSQNIEDIRGAASGTNILVTSGNVTQWTAVSGAAVVQGVRIKNALALAPSNFALARNGAIFGSQASGILPVAPTRFAVGNNSGGSSSVGNFRQVAVFPIRGSNAGIQALTQ